MRIINDVKYEFDDLMLTPKRSTLNSRSEVDITREFKFHWTQTKWTGIPIFAANMSSVGTIEMARELSSHSMCTALHKHYSIEELISIFTEYSPYIWYSMGIAKNDLDKFNNVKNNIPRIPNICIDVANGYIEKFVNFVSKIREQNPFSVIMCGNVVTPEISEQLILAGADIIKIGISGGSVCTTRSMTGFGYAQASAILETADSVHGLGGLICSDGGCKVYGDIVKAFGLGTDFVMLGGMFAGTNESGGELITDVDGSEKKEYYGMSSYTAQDKHIGHRADHRASEGKRVLLPPKGPVKDIIKEMLGGLRSGCSYAGARKLKELTKRATFTKVNHQRNTVFDQYDAD